MCPYRQIWYPREYFRIQIASKHHLTTWCLRVPRFSNCSFSRFNRFSWGSLGGVKSTNDKKGKQPTYATYLKTAYCKSKRLLKKEAKQASNENSNVKLLFELSWFRGLSVLVHLLASVVNRCKPCRHNLAIRTQQKLSGSVSRMASQETNLKAPMMSWCDTSCANRTQHYPTMSSWFWWSHLLLWYVLWCRRPACGQVPRATRKSCKLSLPPKISDTLVLIGTGMYSMISMGPRVSKIQILEMWAYWIWLALSNSRLEPELGTENEWKWRCCWLKSCTTWDVWKPINHGINMDKLPIHYRISAINNSNWNLSKRCSNFSWRWLCISLCSSKSRITVASIAVHCPWNINERTQKNLKFNKIP